jgi:adenine-specific DNA-methyltransferase
VSCNDIEQAHLKLLLAEVFGEEQFIATFVWNNEGNIDNQSKVKTNHEYIHVFARDAELLRRPSVIDPNIEESSKLFREEIENSITKNGPANPPSTVDLPAGFPATFAEGSISKRSNKWPHILDEVVVKDSRLTRTARVRSGWSSRNLLQLYIDNGLQPIRDAEGKETRFAITPTGAIYGYKRRAEDQGHVLTVIRNVGTTKQNSNMLSGWGLAFDWPKPVLLIRYLCAVFTKEADIVLDFFAGACTTAQAVLELNRADGGRRQFVCVQLPEPGRGQFATLADMGKERIRRAIGELPADTSRPEEDLGFRVLKLARSHFAVWQDYEGNDPVQLEALFDAAKPLVPSWTRHGLLTEVMLLEGFPLDSALSQLPLGKGNTISVVTSHYCQHRLIVCLDPSIKNVNIDSIQVSPEDVFVCLDSAATDEAKLRLGDRCTVRTI